MSRSAIVNNKLRHLSGWKKSKADHRDFKLASPGPVLPSHASLLAACPAVLDQGQIGSCHDDQTEVLTEHGWTLFADLTEEECLATVDPISAKLVYERPTHIVRLPFSGDMVVGQKQTLDFCVTPNHKMLVKKWDDTSRTLASIYIFVDANDIDWYSGLMNRVKWEGEETGSYVLPGVPNHKHKLQREMLSIPMTVWLQFLGIYLAEGTMIKSTSKHYKIQIAASKEREKGYIRSLLQELGVHALELKDRFTFENWQIYEEMVRLDLLGVLAPDKFVPEFVFKQSAGSIRKFLHGHFMGDGSKQNGHRSHYTSSPILADDLQRLIFLSGEESFISIRGPRNSVMADGREIRRQHPEYRISVCEKKNLSLERSNDISHKPYNGIVYCAEVPTFHTLVTRRNGRILISGNCTANASSEAMEFLEEKGHSDSFFSPFSRLYIYYYARQLEGTPPSEDSGAEIRDVMKVLATRGAPYETVWPYENPEARFSMKPPTVADVEAAKHKILFYYACINLHTVKVSIAQGFPVVFGFSVPDNMMSDAAAVSGEIHYPGPTEGFQGGHAVLAVGYDDSKVIGHETGAILCQNSWGTGWGLSGCFWLPYRFWVESLADDNWTIRKMQF